MLLYRLRIDFSGQFFGGFQVHIMPIELDKKKIFWIAGERSGDLHASNVLKTLKKSLYDYYNLGIGGPLMQKQGLKPLFPFNRFAVMGFVEVLKHLKFFLKVEKRIQWEFENNPPDLVVLVDYPGFNMRIARMADNLGIPVLYYVSPQFWAWKHKRVHQLKDYTRHVAVILPFEKELLDIHRVNCTYVGHPIAEEISIDNTREQFARAHNLDMGKKWLGFFPGSREIEVSKMLPPFLNAIKLFDPNEYEFLISTTSNIGTETYLDMTRQANLRNFHLIEKGNYSMMAHCDFLVVTSGTATIETAFIGTPFIIVYKTSWLSYELGKRLVKIKRIGLPNIILEDDVIPELIQGDVNGKTIHQHIMRYMNDETLYRQMRERLREIHKLLGEKEASVETARIALNLLQDPSWIDVP